MFSAPEGLATIYLELIALAVYNLKVMPKETDNKKINEDIGKRIKKARTALELVQKQFVAKLGISPPYLSEIENGERRPSVVLLRDMAMHFGINPNYLLLGRGRMFLATDHANPNKLSQKPEDFFVLDDYDDLLWFLAKSKLFQNNVIVLASDFFAENKSVIIDRLIQLGKIEGK